nr:MAG TPA: homing endonuclease [Caudoviricetes sp.]
MKKTKETWKPITCTDNVKYEVSSEGNVRILKTGRILKPCYNTKGYARVDLTSANNDKTKKTRKLVHRLVAQAFIPNNDQSKTLINHKDENPRNNSVANLEWCTHKYNANYGTRNERVGKSKSKPIQQLDMKTGLIIATYPSLTEAGLSIGIYKGNISRVAKGKRKTAGGYGWKYQN